MSAPLTVRLAALAVLCPARLLAQSCDAYFPFDGDLSDASGNGYDGTMIGAGGGAGKVDFGTGVMGEALHLDGASAMRAFLDLREESCPQVTITAWIRVDSAAIRGTRYLVSTGAGSGPSLRSSGTTVVLAGTGNGLSVRDALRDGRAWFFFAGVFDYGANTYRIHWRDRVVEGTLATPRRPPEDAFWVGAYNDDLDYVYGGAWVDELRITGKVLSKDEITRMRGGRPGGFVMAAAAAAGSMTVASPISASGTPQPVSGTTFPATGTPRVSAEDLPERPPDLLNGGLAETGGEFTPSVEAPAGLGAGRDGTLDPGLAAPGDDPASELQDNLATIQEAGLEQVLAQRALEGERNFGPRNRTQVVLDDSGQVAYAGTPQRLLVSPFGLAYELPDSLLPNLPVESEIQTTALPGIESTRSTDIDASPQVREVFRFRGTNGYLIVWGSGRTQVIGDPEGRHALVADRIQKIFADGRPVDLVANDESRYFIVSGTNVYARDPPPGAEAWAQAELAAGVQVTAFAILPGSAWIGVSGRAVQSGGLNRAHWGMDLLNDVQRLVSAGEKIHDISTAGDSTDTGHWAIATDRQIFYHQTPAAGTRFPSCRAYQRSNDDFVPVTGRPPREAAPMEDELPVEFGQTIEAELNRDWSCWYPDHSCLARFPTWTETDMGSPADPSEFLLNVRVTLGVNIYTGLEKEIVDCWLADQLGKVEDVFSDEPGLKFRVQTEFRQSVGGVDIVNYVMESEAAHSQFMDAHFDVQAKSRTEGFFPILVVHRACVGYEGGMPNCGTNLATLSHYVDPTQRQHGIMFTSENPRPDLLSHEMGHDLALKHTFEPYFNPDPDMNCNRDFTPKGDGVLCNSCEGSFTGRTCSADYNVMDYCTGPPSASGINACQVNRAINQRERYMTNDGRTDYSKMKGRLGEPYCSADGDCLDDEFCDTGVLTIGRNYCNPKLPSGAACSRGGQCASGSCSLLSCN